MALYPISRATATSLTSLSTIEARAFHPTNAFHKRCFPDSPLVRQWWSSLFSCEISDPSCHPLLAQDPQAIDESLRAIGILLLRRFEPGDEGAGIFSEFPFTSEHDHQALKPMCDHMTEARPRLMRSRGPHLLVEYLGVDHGYQGRGVGSELLRHACKVADDEGIETIVEANGAAQRFYERHGFAAIENLTLPGPEMYTVGIMVRKPKL